MGPGAAFSVQVNRRMVPVSEANKIPIYRPLVTNTPQTSAFRILRSCSNLTRVSSKDSLSAPNKPQRTRSTAVQNKRNVAGNRDCKAVFGLMLSATTKNPRRVSVVGGVKSVLRDE